MAENRVEPAQLAFFAADVAGYNLLMGSGDLRAVAIIYRSAR
jgi:hypothetical protein